MPFLLILFIWFTRVGWGGVGGQMVETLFKNDSFFVLNLFDL